MRPRDRVAMALGGEAPDRCPFQAGFTPEFARRLRRRLGLAGPREHNPHGGGNPYDLEAATGQDLLLVSVGWANSYYRREEPYTDEWGVAWAPAPYETPFGRGVYTEIAGHPLADAAALASYRPPDPERPELYAEAARVLRERQDEWWITGVVVCTVFETAWALRGLERLLLDFLEEPALADAILEIPFRYHLAVARRLAAMGVDMVWFGDDVGIQRGMLLSPRLWRRFLKPRLGGLVAAAKAARPGVKVAYHSDGRIDPILDDLVELGVDVLNPLQPACMDLAAVKARYGSRLRFWGGIDEQHTLPFGAPDEVAAEARERIAVLGRGGGYIVAPAHHVQLDTPLENFLALAGTVREALYAKE